MDILRLLLGGQASAGRMGNQPNQPNQPIIDEEILVDGAQRPVPQRPPSVIPDGDMRTVPSDPTFQRERKGMFGVKGTLRDALGLLGDSLLMSGGKQAIYRPVRKQERLSDAYNESQGLNPEEMDQRMIDEDFDTGYKMREDRLGHELKRDQLESLDDNREAMAEYKGKDLERREREFMARVEDWEKRRGISQQNADANTTRANRPPAGRAPRATTPLEYFQSIDGKPENERTKGEQAFYSKYTASGRGGKTSRISGGSGAKPASAAGGSSRIDMSKWRKPNGPPLAQ